MLRSACIYSSKALLGGVGSGRLRNIGVPELISDKNAENRRYVIKSVDSLNRAHLFSKAMPGVKIIHLIRHPCGYVASRLRGIKLNLMGGNTFMASIARMPEADRRGLGLDYLQKLSIEEQLACQWMIQNEKTINDMGSEADSYKLVVYDELCLDPVQITRELFRFSGLDWNAQTEEFLQHCQNAGDENKGYFQVIRNPANAAFHWRNELDQGQVQRILDCVSDSEPGRIFQKMEAAGSGR
jgi:hypothetical protein